MGTIKHKGWLLLVAGFIAAIIIFTCACSSQKITVENALGQKEEFDQPVHKLIATHNPTINSIVALSGGGKNLVGFAFKDRAAGLYERVVDNFDQLPSVWNGHDLDVEGIKQMGAELAIIPESQLKLKDTLTNDCGVRTFVALPQRESNETVKETLKRIGKVIDENDRAKKIVNKYESVLADTYSITEKLTPKKVIFMGATTGETKYSACVPGMIQDTIILDAGGENAVTGDFEEGKYLETDAARFASFMPEYIWIPNYAKFKVEDVLNDPALQNVPAVINKRVYMFPSNLEPWDYPTVASCLGGLWGAYNLHPDVLTKEKLMNTCDDIYELLYNKKFTAEDLGIQ